MRPLEEFFGYSRLRTSLEGTGPHFDNLVRIGARARDMIYLSFEGKPHVEISIEMILFGPRQVPRRYRIRVVPDVSQRAAAQIFQG